MTKTKFITQLLVTTAISLALVALVNYLLDDSGDWNIAIIGLLFFCSLSILMYVLGNKAIVSTNKYQYIRLIVLNMILKIFISFTIVAIYYTYAQPTSKFFIIPFLTIYLVYTVFETSFMIKQSNQNP